MKKFSCFLVFSSFILFTSCENSSESDLIEQPPLQKISPILNTLNRL